MPAVGLEPDEQCEPRGPARCSSERERGDHIRSARIPRLAHPSKLVSILLNDSWQVVDDPLQWILQRRKGRARAKNAGWRSRSFLGTRSGLLRVVGEYCGAIEPHAIERLAALPERHP